MSISPAATAVAKLEVSPPASLPCLLCYQVATGGPADRSLYIVSNIPDL